jgi:two-component system, OmpR family, response regulator
MAKVVDPMIAALEKILCVEDEPDVQSVIKLALGRVGKFDVMVCGNGHEALLEGPGFGPDLMVIDSLMPGMSGPNFLTAARKTPELAAVPAIFLTGKTNPDDLKHYRSVGAVGIIAKPFDVRGLSNEVHKIWNALDQS